MAPVQPLYIHGQYAQANSGACLTTCNPATGELLARVQIAAPSDIDRAVDSAAQGFKVWSALPPVERGRILRRAQDILRARNDELATLEVQDTGKPLQEARVVDVASGADCLEYYAGLAAALNGEVINLGQSFAYTRREPLGVCAAIGAWNYPLQIACWKSAPALACGNAVVYKPSEETPLSALKLAEIYTEAGLPAGVFNVVNGGAAVGAQLAKHDRIKKISLTGSVPTGRQVMSAAAETLKAVTLELGGKSPLIIFDDCDLDNAVSAALLANFYTQGEICSNGTRVFVQDRILPAFLDKLLARTRKMVIGDPMNLETQVGSLIHEKHMNRVLDYIKIGQEEGATLLHGGKRVIVPECAAGFFVEPAIFTNVRDDMRIAQDEIFGPVLSVLGFRDEDEVITRANATPFGLAAGVFTQNLTRGHRVIARLEAGTCWINTYNITPIEMPFGGYKASGLGRENGTEALHHFTQTKSVYVEMGAVDAPY